MPADGKWEQRQPATPTVRHRWVFMPSKCFSTYHSWLPRSGIQQWAKL